MTHVVGSPVWSVRERRSFHLSRFAVFAFAAVAGGVATGLALGDVSGSSGISTKGHLIFGVILALSVARELFFTSVPIPHLRAQVPAQLRPSRFFGPLVYGFILGAAVLTRIPSALLYVYLGALVLFADPLTGGISGAVFGATYAVVTLWLGRATAALRPTAQAGKVEQLWRAARTPATVAAALMGGLLWFVG
jgi:hypothetical protein